jgi:CheY-like chemotaxis protein
VRACRYADLASGAEALSKTRGRILLAEDEPQVRALLARTLGREGWEVTAVGDGHEAVAAWPAGGRPYDLVIMDVNMPGMNGYEAGCHLRRIHPRAGFLFITGLADQHLCRKLAQMGFDLFIKPFSPQQLVLRVLDLVRGGTAVG